MEPIKNYENLYKIDRYGNVYSIKHKKIMKTFIDKDGYHLITLYKNNKYKTFRIHRLVAEQFINNNDNKPQIDHIDGDPSNNNVENLQWVTSSENHLLAYERGRKPNKAWLGKKGNLHNCNKIVECKQLGMVFGSIRQASQLTNINVAAIIRSCKKQLNLNMSIKSTGKHPETGEKLYWNYVN